MNSIDVKLVKIEEVLKYIEVRLAELDTEKEELAEYQRLDREKRSIEYTMHTKEIQDTNHQLEQVCQSPAQEIYVSKWVELRFIALQIVCK